MAGNTLRKSGAFRLGSRGQTVVQPDSEAEVARILGADSRHEPPFRPRGAGSAATDCNGTPVGTIIDTRGLNRIGPVDLQQFTVSVQTGVRIRDLASELAAQGLELEGSHDLMDRSVGGAIASGCIGPSIGTDGGLFASQLCSARLVTPGGNLLCVGPEKQQLLSATRLCYGLLGVLTEVSLRVRPVRPFSASHRRLGIDAFAANADKIARSRAGVKFFLMPFRDRVYLDLRRHDEAAEDGGSLAWRLKDWGESTVLPQVFRSLKHVVPMAGVRYRLVDELSRLTQGLVNNRLVTRGSSSALQPSGSARRLHYSTWVFPASDFGVVARAYRDFCVSTHESSGFRCDMPAMGFRLSRDTSALLSPLFDEPMMALRAVSTQQHGWEDFAMDFAAFAEHWGGQPLFNQSRCLTPDHAQDTLGARLQFFRKIRRRIDPHDRMLSPFLAQFFL